jgi:hypothetical protein
MPLVAWYVFKNIRAEGIRRGLYFMGWPYVYYWSDTFVLDNRTGAYYQEITGGMNYWMLLINILIGAACAIIMLSLVEIILYHKERRRESRSALKGERHE